MLTLHTETMKYRQDVFNGTTAKIILILLLNQSDTNIQTQSQNQDWIYQPITSTNHFREQFLQLNTHSQILKEKVSNTHSTVQQQDADLSLRVHLDLQEESEALHRKELLLSSLSSKPAAFPVEIYLQTAAAPSHTHQCVLAHARETMTT